MDPKAPNAPLYLKYNHNNDHRRVKGLTPELHVISGQLDPAGAGPPPTNLSVFFFPQCCGYETLHGAA